MSDQQPGYQRLTLTEPVDGWFGDFSVRLVDVSASGAQIEHDDPLPPDANGLLRFYWRGREVEILSKTARTIQENRTGLQFVDDNKELRELIEMSAAEVLRALQANASGNRAANIVGDETLTSAWHSPVSGYVCWTLGESGWSSHASSTPDQPENGFTICASEADDQVEMLRQTYESGDDESRRLTRMLAELSVAAAS